LEVRIFERRRRSAHGARPTAPALTATLPDRDLPRVVVIVEFSDREVLRD
jgi:hypothetical protein